MAAALPERSFLRPPGRGTTARSLAIAALWSMVGILVGGLVVLTAGVVAAVVAGVAWLVGRGSGEPAGIDTVWRAVTFAAALVAPLVIGFAVWVAAYGSTEWGSRRRALVGVAAAAVGGAGYLLLGSSGLVLAALALGWAVTIPAERVGRIAARAVLSLAAALFMPAMRDLAGGWLVLVLVASPWVAVAFMLAGDAAWSVLTGFLASRASETPEV